MITYRNATAQDSSLIMDIKFRSTPNLVESAWGWDPVIEVAYYSKYFQPETYTIVLQEEQVVGFYSIEQVGVRTFCLEAIVVDISFQRKGIGTLILSDLIKTANLELSAIEVSIQKKNANLKRFYERHGFKTFSQSVTHYIMRYYPANHEN